MTRTGRILTLIGQSVALTGTGTRPASATFSGPVPVSTSVATGTVAPLTSVRVGDHCTTTSISAAVDQDSLQFQPQVSDLTLTGYGWTAESARTAVLAC